MFIAMHYFNAAYGSVAMIRFMLPAEILMILICSIIISRYFSWSEIGFIAPLNTKSLVWLIPIYMVLIVGWAFLISDFNTLKINRQQWEDFALIGFVTLLVGVAEELMFRGIILHALLDKISPRKAVIVSAFAFSVLHSINIIGGVPIEGMILQLGLTFIAGFYLAGVMVKIKSIIPLIVWHWLWDFLTLSSDMLGHKTSEIIIVTLILFELVFGLVIWFGLKTSDYSKLANAGTSRTLYEKIK